MNYKQIILIRTDIDMRCGKKCVQVAHASLMGADAAPKDMVEGWKSEGMRKIVLKVPDLDHLMAYWNESVNQGVCGSIVKDFGLTQLEPNTITCVGFAPYLSWSREGKFLDELTKELSLL